MTALATVHTQPRDHRYRTGTGLILHGLGDGPGSVHWQSDVMPSQFWQDRHLSNEQRLCLAVLEDALRCLEEVLGPVRWSRRVAYDEAVQWFASTRDAGLYDFVSVCHALGWDAGWIRAGILARKEAV